MTDMLGQFDLKHKGKLFRDCEFPVGNNAAMKSKAATEFIAEFQARMRGAREAKGYTQTELAELMNNMEQGTYKNYESRPTSLLPHELVPLFCAICDVEIEWLFTGRGRGPAVSRQSLESRRRRRGSRAAA